MDDKELIARVCHEVQRVNDPNVGDWKDLTEIQKETMYIVIQKIMNKEITSPEDAHNIWMKEMQDSGWIFGKVKNETKKTHPCIKSYSKLLAKDKTKDVLFFSVARAMLNIRDQSINTPVGG